MYCSGDQGLSPMLMIVNDVLVEPKAPARMGLNDFGRVSKRVARCTEAN
jgi:hypothetical protein